MGDEVGSMEERKKRVGRAVTQRYDMASLRVVQGLEGKFNEDVAALYGCDEDELPFDIDTLGIFQSPPGSRRAQLEALFTSAPSDPAPVIEALLAGLESLDSTVAAKKAADEATKAETLRRNSQLG